MKKCLNFFAIAVMLSSLVFTAHAQGDKSKRPSPPMTASGKAGSAEVTIDYGAPSVKGREIYGDLVPYGKVWRTGANEATTFSVSKDVTINGQPLAAGKYALFTIPEKGEWTVIFNKNPKQWGAYDYKEDQDALRIKVKPEKTSALQEQLKFGVGDDGKVKLAWEHQSIEFTVSAK
jgi:hypothetical protein